MPCGTSAPNTPLLISTQLLQEGPRGIETCSRTSVGHLAVNVPWTPHSLCFPRGGSLSPHLPGSLGPTSPQGLLGKDVCRPGPLPRTSKDATTLMPPAAYIHLWCLVCPPVLHQPGKELVERLSSSERVSLFLQ